MNDTIDWKKSFQEFCEEMTAQRQTTRTLPDRGVIVWYQQYACSECETYGTFYGSDLEYGAFYECASARFCPTCHKVFDVQEGINFAPYGSERFLPIMKKKVMAGAKPIRFSGAENPCPQCGAETATFRKDLGGVDYYDNTWTVCPNPECDWPGSHSESYERGPF